MKVLVRNAKSKGINPEPMTINSHTHQQEPDMKIHP